MALIGKIAIAMTVNTQKFGQGLKGAAGQLVGFQARIESTGHALQGLFAAAAGIGAAAGLKKMVMTASDLNENMSKTEAIFGTGSKAVVHAADEMAAAFGTSRNQFLDAAGRMGGLFKGAGYTADEAANLSVQFTKLSADASSFYNLPFDQAFTKIRAGLSGESEPLKDLGILMNEDMVKAQAFAMGLAKQGQELSNQAKVQARAAIIARGLADAQGDLAKTADGVANRTRELGGRIENLAGAMGTSLQPIAQTVLGDMSTAVDALGLAWQDNSSAVIAWAQSAIGGIAGTAGSMGILQRSIGFAANAWDVLRLGFYAAQSYITEGIAKLVDGLRWFVRTLAGTMQGFASFLQSSWLPGAALMGDSLSILAKGLADVGKASDTFTKTLSEDLHRLADDQWAGFQKKLAEAWPSESVDKYFAQAQQKTADLRKAMAAAPKAALAAAPAAGGLAKKTEQKHAEAMVAGSREATNAILRSRYGSSPEARPAEATAKNTARTVQVLEQISSYVGARAGGAAKLLFGGNF